MFPTIDGALWSISRPFVIVLGLTAGALAQGGEVPADTVIRMERTSCFGTCPVYSVTIDAAGTVTYDGHEFVRAQGRQTARIAPSLVAGLLARAGRIHFFEMRDAYREITKPDGSVETVTDLPTTIVSITVNGRTKRVEDYFGAPDDLPSFERAIDDAGRTERWIFVDEETLAALLRSGWSARSDEGAKLLREALTRDEVAIARSLIEAGAEVNGSRDNLLPPLVLARSGAMVALLVSSGADANERPAGKVTAQTPLMASSYKDAGVAEALLKAGAHVEDMEDGRTALWYAACAGNWRVLSVLLRAGANPRGGTDTPAIDCARAARQDALRDRDAGPGSGRPTSVDFDRVITLLEHAGKHTRQ